MGGGVSAFFGNDLQVEKDGEQKFRLLSNWDDKMIDRLAKLSHVKSSYKPFLRRQLKEQERERKKRTSRRSRRRTRALLNCSTKRTLRRSNSSNSFFVSSTMLSLDHYALIICVSAAMHARVRDWTPNVRKKPHLNCFVDDYPPRCPAGTRVPSVKEFRTFLTFVYRTAQLEPEGLILSLVYYERILSAFGRTMRSSPTTWRPLVLISLILASKMFDDLSMINVDFSTVCKQQFSLEKINQMELTVVLLLRFALNVSVSEYARYYFNLRRMLGTSILQAARAPLRMKKALRMYSVSGTYEAIKGIENLSQCRTRRTRTYADGGEMFADRDRPLNLEQISWHTGLPMDSL